MSFGVMTQEERVAALAKAHAKRIETAAFNKANEHLYKLEYLDSNYWQSLATKYKVRMPVHNVPASVKGIRKYLKKAGVSNDQWAESYGSVSDWVRNNPKYTLYAAVGNMLELREGM